MFYKIEEFFYIFGKMQGGYMHFLKNNYLIYRAEILFYILQA